MPTHTHTATTRRRRWWHALTALAALVTLVGLVAGTPVGLRHAAARLLPTGWTHPGDLPHALLTHDTGTLFIQLVIAVAWVAWASFLLSLAVEVAARLAGRRPPAVPGLRGPQHLARVLLATVAALAVTPQFPTAHAAPLAPATASADAVPEQQPQTPAPTPQTPTPMTHEVVRGEALLDLQARYGVPWQAIAAANWGMPQPDGQQLERGQTLIHPGWQLRIPASTGGHHEGGPLDTATTPAADQDPPQAGDLVHEVAESDWMWHIAGRYLGDELRYPEVAALNPDLAADYPQFPDHIQPGDLLVLPDDAEDSGPRQHATGELVPPAGPPAPDRPPADPPDERTPPPTPSQSPVAPGTTPPGPDPDGVADPPGTPPSATAVPPSPSYEPAPGTDTPAVPGVDHDRGDGVSLPDGSWLPWTVAAAVAAAMAVVWLQRRRRYTPRHIDDPGADRPTGATAPVVRRILAALRTRSQPEPDEPEPEPGLPPWDESSLAGLRLDPAGVEPDEPPPFEPSMSWPPAVGSAPLPTAPPVPTDTPPDASAPVAPAVVGWPGRLPAGGVGLVGPGAPAAARGALVAVLAAGAPTDPDARVEVVAVADTLVSLLGGDAVALGGWPRLRVADDLPTALAVVQTRLLAAARLLDEYEVQDLATLRLVAPAERPMPPLLLLADPPDRQTRMQTRAVLGIGADVDVTGLLLGDWDERTVHVDTDGTCHGAGGGPPPAGVPTRMTVLELQPTSQLLATLREAHTATPPPPGFDQGDNVDHTTAAAAPPVPAPGDQDTQDTPEAGDQPPTATAEPAGPAGPSPAPEQAAPPRAVARVLGEPQIVGWQAAGRPLRKAAVELLVHLAVHPDGVSPDMLLEDMFGDSRRRLAATKLHTAASNLRHLLAAAAGAPEQAGRYVHKEKGRYRLAADAVEVDLWTLQAARRAAAQTGDPRRRAELLRTACHAYSGELAAGRGYEWATAAREAARAAALDVHTALAGLLADDDPPEAARLLVAATHIDPMAEHVYRQAMTACHRAGDTDTIDHLLRRLGDALEDVGGEPAEETVHLAEQLRHAQPATAGRGRHRQPSAS